MKLFREKLGYTYLGDWTDREDANIEQEHLRAWLKKQKVDETRSAGLSMSSKKQLAI